MQRDNLWHFSEGVSRASARHTWKFGFDGSHFTMAYRQSHLARGQYTFTGAFTSRDGTPVDTGDPFADFLLGFPQTTSRNVGSTQAYLRQNTYAGYVQDDWRASGRLTLNFGLRYEYFAPFTEDRGNLLNLDYSSLPNPPRLAPVSAASNPDPEQPGSPASEWRSGCRTRPCFAPAMASTSAPKSPLKATTWC